MSENNKESFFSKYKNDKKYKAKVQLIGYSVFIIILVLILNVGNASGTKTPTNTLETNIEENTSQEETILLESVTDNYSYETIVSVTKKGIDNNTLEEVKHIDTLSYVGKVNGKNMEIRKNNPLLSDMGNLYYKVDNSYYSMIDNATTLIKDTEVYNLIEAKYIELSGIKKLINEASLDHVTEYSNGKIEKVYHFSIKNIINEFIGTEVIELSVIEEDNKIVINIDYSNLFSNLDSSITECTLNLIISDINKIDEFQIYVSPIEDKE